MPGKLGGPTRPVSACVRENEIRDARRQRSHHGITALIALLIPAVAFPVGLILLCDDVALTGLNRPTEYPWELGVIAVFGTAATLAGLADWWIHRSGTTVVGVREHRAHLAALGGGGVPLFLLMAAASLSRRPLDLLLPILVVLILTVTLICYDEFLFHRRCGKFEAWMHRVLTFGNGLAFLAWAHWCFVRGGSNV